MSEKGHMGGTTPIFFLHLLQGAHSIRCGHPSPLVQLSLGSWFSQEPGHLTLHHGFFAVYMPFYHPSPFRVPPLSSYLQFPELSGHFPLLLPQMEPATCPSSPSSPHPSPALRAESHYFMPARSQHYWAEPPYCCFASMLRQTSSASC